MPFEENALYFQLQALHFGIGAGSNKIGQKHFRPSPLTAGLQNRAGLRA